MKFTANQLSLKDYYLLISMTLETCFFCTLNCSQIPVLIQNESIDLLAIAFSIAAVMANDDIYLYTLFCSIMYWNNVERKQQQQN